MLSFFRLDSILQPPYLLMRLIPSVVAEGLLKSTRQAGGWKPSCWFRWTVGMCTCGSWPSSARGAGPHHSPWQRGLQCDSVRLVHWQWRGVMPEMMALHGHPLAYMLSLIFSHEIEINAAKCAWEGYICFWNSKNKSSWAGLLIILSHSVCTLQALTFLGPKFTHVPVCFRSFKEAWPLYCLVMLC